jgi:hypothetical protein
VEALRGAEESFRAPHSIQRWWRENFFQAIKINLSFNNSSSYGFTFFPLSSFSSLFHHVFASRFLPARDILRFSSASPPPTPRASKTSRLRKFLRRKRCVIPSTHTNQHSREDSNAKNFSVFFSIFRILSQTFAV